jgi:hypothetical protein
MAFVDGDIIRGVAELLFAVVRDLAYTAIELAPSRDLSSGAGITDAVFGLLRNARVLHPGDPNLVVCWGGHSIIATNTSTPSRSVTNSACAAWTSARAAARAR